MGKFQELVAAGYVIITKDTENPGMFLIQRDRYDQATGKLSNTKIIEKWTREQLEQLLEHLVLSLTTLQERILEAEEKLVEIDKLTIQEPA